MTSTSAPAYPSEYYYPEFISIRSDDPHLSPPKPPPLSITATTSSQQLTDRTKNLATNVVTRHGLPDVDINESGKTDPQKDLIRSPIERNVPRVILNQNIIKQAIRSSASPVTNLDNNQYIERKQIPNIYINENLSYKNKQQHRIVKFVDDEQLINDQGIVEIEPVTYDGPYSLTRKGAFIFYIGMSLFTLLAAIFLIMTAVFYGQNYPDSSSNIGELVGISICAFAFYLGLQIILIGLWHKKYRQENPIEKIKKKSTVDPESTDHLKSSMKNNKQYHYSYQPPINYPPYVSNINEQMLLQQQQSVLEYYDGIVRSSNVGIENLPDTKFFQLIESSLEVQQQSIFNETSSISDTNYVTKSNHQPMETIEAEPSVGDFDNLRLNSNVIEQQLPILPKTSETNELINSTAQMELTNELPIYNDSSLKNYNRIQPIDNKTDVSSLVNIDKTQNQNQPIDNKTDASSSVDTDKIQNQDHPHHHRRHHHHHHLHRPHHHHHHHRHRYHLNSQDSRSPYYSHNLYHDHHNGGHHHHHFQSAPFPRIVTPHLPKIITPQPKIHTKTYRETGINTGNETKIMRDSSVTADLHDIPTSTDDRLDKIPVIRRTIIVEPYPAQPSTKIIVKPRADMTGKIRLTIDTKPNGDNETVIYPSTAFLTKTKSKKKKKSSLINNNIIEDLHLEDINDDNNSDQSIKIKTTRSSTRKTIKNAFYN